MLTLLFLIVLSATLVGLVGVSLTRMKVRREVNVEGIEDAAAAEAYGRVSRWPQFKLVRRMFLGELTKLSPTGVLVDVGCGPGYLVAEMAQTFPGLNITGVDISEEMVELATKNYVGSTFAQRVRFRQGDIQDLPFEESSVDFVVSTLSLHHWSDAGKAFGEIRRVLKPRGRLLILDSRRDARRLFYWMLRFAQIFVVPSVMRRSNEPSGSVLSSYTPAEIELVLSATGFGDWKIKGDFGWMLIYGRKS